MTGREFGSKFVDIWTRHGRVLGPGLIGLLAFVLYLNSFPGTFFMDDRGIVADNPLVAQPDLKAIFSTDYWGEDSNSGLYRPLTILSFALNRLLLGADPWGYHLVNVLLYALAAFLVCRVALAWGWRLRVALVAGLLFAVHPIHGEVVNQMVGRSELLVAVFLLAAFVLARMPGPWPPVFVAICFGLALLSKEHAIVFLAALPLVDIFLGGRGWRPGRSRLILYGGLLLLGGLWLALRTWGVFRSVPPVAPDPVYIPLQFLPEGLRHLSALKLQLLYLWKLAWPVQLQGFYSAHGLFAPVDGKSLGWMVSLPLVFLLLLVLLLLGWRRRREPALAMALYFISFVPTSNLLFATGVTFAERLAFFPSIWACLAAASLADRFITASRPGRYGCFGIVAAIVMTALGWATLVHNGDFRSPSRYWEVDVQAEPRDVVARTFLAEALSAEGRTVEAEASLRQVIELEPHFAQGLHSYALFLSGEGRSLAAIDYARRAIAADPQVDYPPAHLTMARELVKIGEAGRALVQLERLGGRYKRLAVYWETRGEALQMLGDVSGALQAFEREQELRFPAEAERLLRQAYLLIRLERFAEAQEYLQRQVRLKETSLAWNALGVVFALQNRHLEARDAFVNALRLNPDSREMRLNLQRAMGQGESFR